VSTFTRKQALDRLWSDAYEDASSFDEPEDVCRFSADRVRSFYADCSDAVLAGALEDHLGWRPTVIP
jgi:hypothetical protein